MRKFFSFFSGALIGGLIGASLAILFAPSSGTNMRLELQQRFEQFRQDVQKAASDRRAELEEQLASLRNPQIPS